MNKYYLKWVNFLVLFFILFFSNNSFANNRKIVIVSATYGAGHNSSADAIKKQIETEFPGSEVKILYAENYMRFGLGEWSKEAFNRLYQNNPGVYDVGFFLTMWDARGKTSADQFTQIIFKEKELFKDLKIEQPDLVYSTHHISTSMLIKLRKNGDITKRNFQIGWVDTDFVHEPFFYLNSLDVEKTFMAHPALTSKRIELGVPAEKMATTGLPISPVVFEKFDDKDRELFLKDIFTYPDRIVTNKKDGSKTFSWPWVNGKQYSESYHPLTIDKDSFMITIASGGAGLGDYPVLFKSLLDEAIKRGKNKLTFFVMCGSNQVNYEKIIEYYNKAGINKMKDVTLVVTKGVDNAKLMRVVHSSHAFVGKSGSQSPMEAAIMGIPSVLGDFLGGQEHHTARFFKDQGLADVVKKNNQIKVGPLLFDLLEDKERMMKMKIAQKITKEAYDMKPIAKFAKDVFDTIDLHGKDPIIENPNPKGFSKYLQKICISSMKKGAY